MSNQYLCDIMSLTLCYNNNFHSKANANIIRAIDGAINANIEDISIIGIN